MVVSTPGQKKGQPPFFSIENSDSNIEHPVHTVHLVDPDTKVDCQKPTDLKYLALPPSSVRLPLRLWQK